MIVLLSPSKSINFKLVEKSINVSTPLFLEKSEILATAVGKLGDKLADTLGVSDKLAQENKKRFADWTINPSKDSSSPAAWAYRGETFAGLSIEKLDPTSLELAQQHLYIVSGLYGLLRPQDAIMPYRLEMSTKLKGAWGKNLYEFWGTSLADSITAQKPEFILNCASEDYSKAVIKQLPKDIEIITPKFLHCGKSKMAFSKYARGLMARWSVEQKISISEDFIRFNEERFTYVHVLSKPSQPVFIAPENFTLKGRWVKT